MVETRPVWRVLVDHFFRRFFDNDTIQVEGDTLTTVARAIAIFAAPGLMFAFFLQSQYPMRPLWGRVEDEYFFVLFSLVAMGVVTIFEWEMLFPDRLDFLILSPLSVKPIQMLAAKGAALVAFLEIFLVAANMFGALVLPLVTRGDFFRQVYAHAAAVVLAGAFAALCFLAVGGLMLCVLSEAAFRLVSPVVRMLSVMALVLVVVHYVKFGGSLQALRTEPLGRVRFMPTMWFLGVYEWLLRGSAAPPFAHQMALSAVRATAAAAGAAVLTYPLAWVRVRRMAVEGGVGARNAPGRWWSRAIHAVVTRPGQRAAFHFIGQTMARNNRYQVYLAMYAGTGLALAVACAVTIDAKSLRLALSDTGLHAMMPLLLFWLIAGLRTAFAFPMNLAAGWVFRISGVDIGECAAAARRWVLFCGLGVVVAILALLRVAGWDWRRLVVQAVCGVCLAMLLTDGFFFSQQTVPFNQPRMPGKANFPLMLTLYIGVLTPYVYGVIYMEMAMEKAPAKMLLLAFAAAALHRLGEVSRRPPEIEEEMEGYEGEFQLLGLS